MNRVTIAIPCYKQAQYLPQAIESALRQTTPCDIIVIDDGSPDDSAEVASRYPVKLIRQVNKGLPSARNTALMNCQTEFFFPLDADDILLDNCIESLLKKADESGAEVVAPSLTTFGVAAETITLMPEPRIEDFLLGNRIGYFSLIRTVALKEVGGYSPKMVYGWEDYHLWFNLLSRGKRIVTVPVPLVLYRTKEGSMWHESRKHERELWDQIFKDFPQLLPGEIMTV